MSATVALWALWAADQANACAVCSDPDDPRSDAYFDMTIFLSLLPLIAMGIVGLWIYRRMAALDERGSPSAS